MASALKPEGGWAGCHRPRSDAPDPGTVSTTQGQECLSGSLEDCIPSHNGWSLSRRPVHAVSGDRRERVLAELARGTGDITAVRLCKVAETVTRVSGAGIMIMASDRPAGSLCTSSAVSAAIEDLQYTLGEGPCLDAYHLDRPVLEPDLADPTVERWLAFPAAALEAGARAVFGFPLRVGSVRLGALNLCSERAGPLSADQHADALVMADVAAEAVLAIQAGAPPGELAAALEAGSNLQSVVHQAAGMVSVQLDVSIPQAFVRLRAHAFANGRPLAEVAADVVARRLRFDDVGEGEP